MKVLPFSLPVAHDKTILIKDETLRNFYPILHQHNEIQITLILKGEGTLVAGEEMYTFHENEIYVIGANIPHLFRNESGFCSEEDPEVQSLTIFFNPKERLAPLLDLPELTSITAFLTRYSTGFKVPAEETKIIADLIRKIKSAEPLDSLIYFIYLLKTLSRLENIDHLTHDLITVNGQNYDQQRINELQEYIHKNYDEDLTLEQLASVACMTQQAFCRYFKKHTQMTFVEYLNKVRINEACKKLINGSYSNFSSLAYDCGFNSITNFNRVFKSFTGKSPRSYLAGFFQNVN